MLGARRFLIRQGAEWNLFVGDNPLLELGVCVADMSAENIELYNIICDSVGIQPASNNGTLRLPLTPIGLHTDPNTPSDETPADPVDASTPTSNTAIANTAVSSSISMASASASSSKTASPTSSAPPVESSKPADESWWEWLTHKAEHAEEWVDEFLHKHMPGDKVEDGDGEVDESGGREIQG